MESSTPMGSGWWSVGLSRGIEDMGDAVGCDIYHKLLEPMPVQHDIQSKGVKRLVWTGSIAVSLRTSAIEEASDIEALSTRLDMA